MYNLKVTKYGYRTVYNPPTQKELEEYYQAKYYQEAKGSYELQYDKEEIRYFENKISESAYIFKQHGNGGNRFLDVGCGEGWALSYFKRQGWQVCGLDFSSYGCEEFNPNCIDNLIVGDVYSNLATLIDAGEKYDLVFLDNVLEHVLDPEGLVRQLRSLMAPGGILVVDVPNDYSILQQYLLERQYVKQEFWLVLPDHLSYFDKTGLENLFVQNGWSNVITLADYPIDWNLINTNTNYIDDKAKGKSCHRERIELENLIHTQPIEKVINFYRSLADLNLGRSVIGYFSINENLPE